MTNGKEKQAGFLKKQAAFFTILSGSFLMPFWKGCTLDFANRYFVKIPRREAACKFD